MSDTKSERQHGTVGRVFISFGVVYRCTRYEKAAGYWMRMVSGEDKLTGRKAGDEACVSERAIGRTYHLSREREHRGDYLTHVQPCECWVCEGREPFA